MLALTILKGLIFLSKVMGMFVFFAVLIALLCFADAMEMWRVFR